jgi:cytochrome b
MKPESHHHVVIWDLPTRIFHWTLVLLVGSNLFLIGPRGGMETVVHFLTGYAITGLLIFRLGWGFIGSPHSRFTDFLHRWPVVKAYGERLRRFDPPHSVGHNPLGGWMIALLLAMLGVMIATGLFAASRRAVGPFAGAIPLPAAEFAGSLHKLISNLLIGLIVAHILGVAVDWFLTGDNLVKAMLTGRKRLPAEAAAREGRLAPAWRAILLALVALAVAAGLSLSTDYARTQSTLAATSSSPP